MVEEFSQAETGVFPEALKQACLSHRRMSEVQGNKFHSHKTWIHTPTTASTTITNHHLQKTTTTKTAFPNVPSKFGISKTQPYGPIHSTVAMNFVFVSFILSFVILKKDLMSTDCFLTPDALVIISQVPGSQLCLTTWCMLLFSLNLIYYFIFIFICVYLCLWICVSICHGFVWWSQMPELKL